MRGFPQGPCAAMPGRGPRRLERRAAARSVAALATTLLLGVASWTPFACCAGAGETRDRVAAEDVPCGSMSMAHHSGALHSPGAGRGAVVRYGAAFGGRTGDCERAGAAVGARLCCAVVPAFDGPRPLLRVPAPDAGFVTAVEPGALLSQAGAPRASSGGPVARGGPLYTLHASLLI